MCFGVKTKDELFDVESWLYEEYGGVDGVLETIEEYFYEDETHYAEFIEEVLNYYPPYDFDESDAMQIYDDFASIGPVKYYEDFLELSDDPILWAIDANIDEYTYYQLAGDFLRKFEKEYDVPGVGYTGRSNRHVVCPDTWENVVRYDELVDGMQKYQQEFVDYINSNYGV